ncbi:MAG: ABC transporter ATP-binding protein [Firmicutes bacterium]|nr:ABC transporter ATP-binding protein [Bacillota bacterium]
MAELLEVEDLKTHFVTRRAVVRAVDGITFTVRRGEALGLAGETGSGKSVAARSIMRIVREPPAKVSARRLALEGEDILGLGKARLRDMWGKRISMIFQDPSGYLNPLLTVGAQMTDVIRRHEGVSRRAALEAAADMLDMVGMPEPPSVLERYPFQLSGGMQQRVMIAMSLSCRPSLLIADEPTTALDVTIQAQIIDLLRRLKEKTSGLILITHDLAVIAGLCDTVAVMYAGKLVEKGPVGAVLGSPAHPYTRGLLEAIPDAGAARDSLPFVRGNIPSAIAPPPGCRFSPRCDLVTRECRELEPEWREVEPGHSIACHLAVCGGGAGVA